MSGTWLKKMTIGCAAVTSVVWLLAGCSVQTAVEALQTVQEQKKPLTADQVVAKSIDAMGKLKGTKWHVQGDQRIMGPHDSGEMHVQSEATFEQDQQNQYHSMMDIDAEAPGENHQIKMEMYTQDQELFINMVRDEESTDGWVKKRLQPGEKDEVQELYQGVQHDTDKILNLFREEGKKVKLHEEADAYRLELTLHNDPRIRSYMDFSDEDGQNLWKSNEGIQYKSMTMTLWVDKKTFRQTQAEQTAELGIKENGKTGYWKQHWTMEFQGEVQQVIIPADVEQNAREIDDSSSY
ncbi:hypothetical protein JIR001_07010 [Polycladomyces abyssicola]|uniref:Lipoprotein n=1 Tax=Polycladomyces abyssicola TaxID=1125966 RepID=A0A8D5UES6_9BACL|nr:DUF6612 family protein [Polycladomyces abyssicola]BCU80918.1 hypothetical protein JIR001_07010 [Polycladomyces abyssicola]